MATLPRFLVLSTLLFTFSAASAAQDACLITPTKCHCAPSTPSGMCMRSQGDGTCLLSACSAGYRCDCFGYEMCTVNKCGKHVPMSSESPSETIPFRCEALPGNALCISMLDVLDTSTASKSAETDASVTNDEATAAEVTVLDILETMQTQKKVINQILKDVERFSDDLPAVELRAVQDDAIVVEDAIQETAEVIIDVVKEADKVCKGLRYVRKLKRSSVITNRISNSKRDELEEEEKKTDKNVIKCERLKKEIDTLDTESKNAARQCGLKSQEIRERKKTIAKKVGECKKVQDRETIAFNGCVRKVKAALSKLSNAVALTA